MNVTVLCPGPSLAAFKLRGDEEYVIGVNRAVLHTPCTHWTATDDRVIRDYAPVNTPWLFTQEESIKRLDRTGGIRFPYLTYESLLDRFPRSEAAWCVYSATAALVLAAHLGATRIDVYGADMAGTKDYDGHQYSYPGEEAERTRSIERWKRELDIWDKTCAMLKEKGVSVIRR